MKRFSIAVVLALLATSTFAADLQIGGKVPAFSLTNAADGKSYDLKPGDGKVSVVMFTCNQCPYARAFEPRMVEIAKKYAGEGVKFYAVNSNDDVRFAEETAENMKSRAAAKSYPFPYLKDRDSAVARSWGARVTPHVFVVDGAGALRYRGYIDDSAKPDQRTKTGLTDAIDAVLAKRPVTTTVTREFGCSIKWKA